MNSVTRETVLDTIQKHAYDFVPGRAVPLQQQRLLPACPILEAVTRMPYARYLQERFFEPLGLESTSYCGYEGREVPVGYTAGDDGLTTARLSDMAFRARRRAVLEGR